MNKVKRIFVLGHPGAGKGLFSQSLAKALNWAFINADLELEITIGLPIHEIIGESGFKAYQKTQAAIINSLEKKTNTVVATDGPIIDCAKLTQLKQSAEDFIVYLKTTTKVQLDRTIRRQETLLDEHHRKDLYDKLHSLRDEKFEKISNLIVDGNHTDIDSQVNEVIFALKKNNESEHEKAILAAKDLTLFHNKTHQPIALTEQQATCLKYLVRGLSAKETANKLSISPRTVEVHLKDLKEKLGCQSIKALIALYHHVV